MNPRIGEDTEGRLTIEWPDGHQSCYELAAVRAACPCAECRGDREAKRSSLHVLRPPDQRRSRLSAVEVVGRYAVCLIWGDGHRTGIYTWQYLRGLCSCVACRLDRAQGEG